jgi:hypothetical protein
MGLPASRRECRAFVDIGRTADHWMTTSAKLLQPTQGGPTLTSTKPIILHETYELPCRELFGLESWRGKASDMFDYISV